MKQLLLTVLIVALLGCKKEEMQPQETSIGFTSAVSTKGVSIETSTIPNFGVFGYCTQQGTWAESAGTIIPDLFDNIEVVRSGKTWSYGKPMKWPGNSSNCTFLGYSPFATGNYNATTAADGNNIIAPAKGQSDVPSLSFTVMPDVEKQVDLLVAEVFDINATNGAVHMNFRHALSRIGFKAFSLNAHTIKVSKIAIKQVKHKATITANNGGTWNSESELADFELTYPKPLVLPENTTKELPMDLSANGNYFLMLPQDLSNNDPDKKIEFTYTVGTSDPIVKSYQIKELWDKGKAVNYTVDLTTNTSAELIVSKVSIVDWAEGSIIDDNVDGQPIYVNLTYSGFETTVSILINENVVIDHAPAEGMYWNTKQDGSGIFYALGETIALKKDATLYQVANELIVNGLIWTKYNLDVINGTISYAPLQSDPGLLFKWGSTRSYSRNNSEPDNLKTDAAAATGCTASDPTEYGYDYVDLSGGKDMGDPCSTLPNGTFRTPTRQEYMDLISIGTRNDYFNNSLGWFVGRRVKECTATKLAPGCIFIPLVPPRSSVNNNPRPYTIYWTSSKSNAIGEGIECLFGESGQFNSMPVNDGHTVRCVEVR